MAYGKLQSSLECIFAPHSSPQDRASAEAWCEEYSTAACQLAATALQQPEVASNQALFWYFVSCVQKHAASRYWHLDRAGKRDMQQEVDSILVACSAQQSVLLRKVYSLQSMMLCWAASEGDQEAVERLCALCRPPVSNGHSGSTVEQLDRCNVLVEDLQTGVLRIDSDSGGVLPSACLQVLRRLFHKRLQPLLVAHVLSVLSAEPCADAEGLAKAWAACTLLTAALRASATPEALGISATQLLQALLPWLRSQDDRLQTALLHACCAVAKLPVPPTERSTTQLAMLDAALHAAGVHNHLLMAGLAHAAVSCTGLTPWTVTEDTGARVQALLQRALQDLPQHSTLVGQLSCVEVWMVWLCRLTDLQDDMLEHEDAARRFEETAAPYKAAAKVLAQALLPCLLSTQGQGAARVGAGACSQGPHSGAELEETLDALALAADAGREVALEQVAQMAGDADACSAETVSPHLAEWQTSEHAVYCGALENAIAHAAELGGHAVASEALAAVAPVMAQASAAVGGMETPAQAAMAAAMDVHVICRCAARCAHSLAALERVQGTHVMRGLLQHSDALVAAHDASGWAAPSSSAAAHAVGATLHLLSSMCAMWLPEALAAADDAGAAGLLALFEPCLRTCTTCLRCSLRLLEQRPLGHSHHEDASLLALAAADALLALTHIAAGSSAGSSAVLLQLRSSSAAGALAESATLLATSPALAGAELPPRILTDVWTSFADVQLGWLAIARKGAPKGAFSEQAWQSAAAGCASTMRPVAVSWEALHRSLAAATAAQWGQCEARVCQAAAFLRVTCAAVQHAERDVKRCALAAVQPMLGAAVRLLQAANQQRVETQAAVANVSAALTAALHSLLSVMEPSAVQGVVSACLQRSQERPFSQHCEDSAILLVCNLSNESSVAIAQLMPEAIMFLFGTLDACMPSIQHHGAAAGHALAATLHVISRQHSVLAKAQPALQTAPLEAAKRLDCVLVTAAADTSRPVVPTALLQAALEAFFDMQRVTSLYKKPEFVALRQELEGSLVRMLMNRIWDGLRDQVLDILWGLGACDWEQFLSVVLPAFCSTCSEEVRSRCALLLSPFADGAGSLHDFAHFASCMGCFVNDVRFFGSLTAWQ